MTTSIGRFAILVTLVVGAASADEFRTVTDASGKPDDPFALPRELEDEANETWGKGYAYFIWPKEPGPFRRKPSSDVLVIPFHYLAKDGPNPERPAFTILVDKNVKNSSRFDPFHIRKDDISYLAKRTGVSLQAEFKPAISSGRARVRAYLLDAETRARVSNECSFDVQY